MKKRFGTPGGSGSGDYLHSINTCRIGLESGVYVSTSDQADKSTLVANGPAGAGFQIGLKVGGSWSIFQSDAQLTMTLSGLTANICYDVFCYANGSTPAIERLAWSSATARATAVENDGGAWVKSGDPSRRLLGTFYATSTTQTQDTARQRLVANVDNRMLRAVGFEEEANSWAYSTATWRQMNGSGSNQVEVVQPIAGEAIDVTLRAWCTHTAVGGDGIAGIGHDSTSAILDSKYATYALVPVANHSSLPQVRACHPPAVGYHYYAALERSGAGTSTLTWYGDNADSGTYGKSGMTGSWRC